MEMIEKADRLRDLGLEVVAPMTMLPYFQRGRQLQYKEFNGYQAYALEQFTNEGIPQYSARVNAPADSATPYVWICAWYTTESWAEAALAAQEMDRRIYCGESFGEHECVRRNDGRCDRLTLSR